MSRRCQFQIFPDVVEEVSPSLVHIEVSGGGGMRYCGSGFIVKSDGVILTNAHVINKHMAVIMVTLQDGAVLQATVIDIDVQADLATLRISASDLPKIKLGDSKNSRPGEWVIAMGSPWGLSKTVTTGVISNISRNTAELAKFGFKESTIPVFIQTDATINPGSSGGPLVNLDGEVIGINTWDMESSSDISFAIPIDFAKEFLKRSTELSFLNNEHLGLGIKSSWIWIKSGKKSISDGMVIRKIVKNSPGQRAGLKVGDILTRINGIPVTRKEDVRQEFGKGNVELLLIHKSTRLGKWISVKVKVTPELQQE